MAKTSDENAEQKRQCKRALKDSLCGVFQVQQRSSGRRRTWAESSVFHGGVGASYAGGSSSGVAGALSYASEHHHDHSCPASQLFTKVSPYKYDRQTSSGHKVFLPSVSN